MRRWLFLTAAAILCVATLPPALAAQEGGDLLQVVTLKVDPPDYGAFQQAIAKIAEAARLANLPAEYGWTTWETGLFEITYVAPVGSMAELDDPEAWMRQFAGTPGEATLTEAMGMMSGLRYQVLSNRVDQHMPSWSYGTDTDMSAMGVARVTYLWLRPGMDEAFSEFVQKWVAFQNEMGTVYPVMAHRPRVGGTGEHTFVVFFDNRESFWGENSFERLVEAKGAMERYQLMLQEVSSLLLDARVFEADRLPALSYGGPTGG